ncbi:hypothetical protein BHE74_00043005 [Ensete ventricosum]|nr:hypothetical protein GW17_00010225 [Ensete ventricosum]RWW50711.1 hypothetical protein BHE74_00043005 [Ensete ventricosum]
MRSLSGLRLFHPVPHTPSTSSSVYGCDYSAKSDGRRSATSALERRRQPYRGGRTHLYRRVALDQLSLTLTRSPSLLLGTVTKKAMLIGYIRLRWSETDTMTRFAVGALRLILLLPLFLVDSRLDHHIGVSSDHATNTINGDDEIVGTRWAVLIAGSNGYYNYRHQVDENIIVFMYDDIADNEDNPIPGVVINDPQGEDVYAGVPKDYVGDDVNVNNFFAVLLGNRTALTGGSGKVIDSGPDDYIFVYYTDHGGPGVLGQCGTPF